MPNGAILEAAGGVRPRSRIFPKWKTRLSKAILLGKLAAAHPIRIARRHLFHHGQSSRKSQRRLVELWMDGASQRLAGDACCCIVKCERLECNRIGDREYLINFVLYLKLGYCFMLPCYVREFLGLFRI